MTESYESCRWGAIARSKIYGIFKKRFQQTSDMEVRAIVTFKVFETPMCKCLRISS